LSTPQLPAQQSSAKSQFQLVLSSTQDEEVERFYEMELQELRK
jgi:hypothetical protein